MSQRPLQAALEAARRLAGARDAEDVLVVLAEVVHTTVGMTAVVNRLRPELDLFEVTHEFGGGEQVGSLLGETYRPESMLCLLDEAYARDGVYVVPHDAPLWNTFEGAVVIEQQIMLDTPDAWHPGDCLCIPLRDTHGEVLAIIVADDPEDGRHPSADRLEALAIAAQQGAAALEARLAFAEAERAEHEAAELSYLSASLAAGISEREILERAAEGVCAACGFEVAAIGLFDDASRLVMVAGAGDVGRRLIGETMGPGEYRLMMQPAHRVSESYLVPAASRPADQRLLHSTQRNGSGPRGWNHHSLAVPLTTGGGAALGLLLVDEPVDLLLPSDGKIRRLELFARQAALLVEGARSLEAARDMATRDGLTGLENGRAFASALEDVVSRGERAALAVLDIDRFKAINDRAGHLRGDALLRDLAEALVDALPPHMRTFRLGGDEFAVLAEDLEAAGISAVLEPVRQRAAEVGVAFSAGAAAVPEHADSGPSLRHAADLALYAAKRAGRGRTHVYQPRLRPSRSPSSALTQALERAAWRPGGSSDLLVTLLDGLVHALAADRGSYYEHDPETDRLVRRQSRTLDPSLVPTPLPEATDLTTHTSRRRTLQSAEPMTVRVDDPGAEPCEAEYLRSLGLGSLVNIPVPVDGSSAGLIELCFRDRSGPGHADLEHAVAVADIAGLALSREHQAVALEAAYRDTVGALATALEAKDADTGDHARALAALAGAVSRRLGQSEEDARLVEYAAIFHDIGKIATPTEILGKPGALTPEERATIERHVVDGARIVGQIGFLRNIAPAVRHSHERWDGHGYPDGLAAEDIPLAARIVFACDTWHAMTSDRVYRKALPLGEALAELRRVAGAQLDPAVVDALLLELGAGEQELAA